VIVRLIVLVLILGISAGFLVEYAEGFIEVKKYKVINSAKVCGDKMCSEIDEERTKKGSSLHNIKICGDKPCFEITSEQENFSNESSPYGQYRLGIDLDLIECKEGKEIIIRKTTQFPACVNTNSVNKLREKSWAILENEQEEIFKGISNSRIKIDEIITRQNLDVSLNLVPEEISNQRYLMFDGFGWHRLHNVEITITGNAFEESVRTKTDDRGHLYMPWPIPDFVGGNLYNIFATDGIHEFEMNVLVASKNPG
jgi:hypothetical protein